MEKYLTIKKGEIIFKAGEVQNWMYYISWGKVGIYADDGEEKRLLTTLGPEDLFGEMGMIDCAPRSATAIAEEDTSLFVVTEETFKNDLLKANMILQNTSRRIRALTKDYVEACQAIGEYVKAEESGEPKSRELMGKLKKIADVVKDK